MRRVLLQLLLLFFTLRAVLCVACSEHLRLCLCGMCHVGVLCVRRLHAHCADVRAARRALRVVCMICVVRVARGFQNQGHRI